jgi:hypothetical protein
MLVLQQRARKAGVLAPALASSRRSGPEDAPLQRRYKAMASPLRHRRHEVDAIVVTSAGPAGGRKAIAKYRAGHQDTS